MRWTSSRSVIWLLLMISVAANISLVLAARHYYALWKLAPTRPTFESQYQLENAAGLATPDGPTWIVFGDSRVRQWAPMPGLTGVTVLNRGIAGETTAQMMYRYRSDVIERAPSVVILQAGINDLVAANLSASNSSALVDSTVENLSNMVRMAVDSEIRVVLLTIIPPASPDLVRRLVWPAGLSDLVGAVNSRIVSLHAPPSVYVLDSQRVLQTATGDWKPGVNLDTLHLTPTGYKELNAAIQGVLAGR